MAISQASFDLLVETDLFGPLPDETRRKVAAAANHVTLASGEVLFRQGDPATKLFVLVSGRLRVTIRQPDGSDRAAGEVGRGESVGETGVLIGGKHSATVTALRDSHLLEISDATFQQLLREHPDTMFTVVRTIASRLQRASSGPSRNRIRKAVVSICPAGNSELTRDVINNIARALAQFGSVTILDAESIDARFGQGASEAAPDDRKHREVTRWLNEQEEKLDFVLYAGSSFFTRWTERGLRQSDRILLIAQPNASPDQRNPVERFLWDHPRETAPVSLVLLDPSERGAVKRWTSLRPVAVDYKIRGNSSDDFARLARFIAGRAYGLVLSGGGARGFAHVGAIRALREANIPVDAVGGTSMGAIVAAQAACGFTIDEMTRSLRRMFVDYGIFDFTFPATSLIAGRKASRMLNEMFGDRDIEDLPIRYFCMTTNLTTTEAVVHDRGPLAKWVRTSISIPGIAPPLAHEGALLCDGGVVNNMPADVMRRYTQGPVIAVNVNPVVDKRLACDSGEELLQGWGAGWRLFKPFGARLRRASIVDILYRTALLGSIRSAALVQSDADLVIEIPGDEYGLFDWKSLDRIVEAGYKAAQPQIARLTNA